MAEYIEREAVLARVKEKSDLFDKKIAPFSAGLYKYLADEVEAMPAADVVEVKRGRWTENHRVNFDDFVGCDVHWYTYACSECGGEVMNNYNFCPNCGADMREAREE